MEGTRMAERHCVRTFGDLEIAQLEMEKATPK
jgi:hypothetical protein